MSEVQERLLDMIRRAFDGVELGEGVSLHETQVIDDHGGPEERKAAREPDEKHDWRKLIDDPDLPRICGGGYAGLCFFDAAGLRFHLPACLSLAVKDPDGPEVFDMTESLLFQLTRLDDYQRGRLAILNDAQRECVRDILIFLRDRLESSDPELDRAIRDYWSSGGEGKMDR